MICYFSGTGNSRLAAEQIATICGDAILSINQALQSGHKEMVHTQRPLVFVAPTYSWRLPRVVERWIRETQFSGSLDAYFILTCGDGCGNAAAYAKKLCLEKGFRYRGLSSVVMPENYLALFSTPNKAEAQEILEHARPRIATLAEQIQSGKDIPEPAVSLLGKLESGPVNPLFYHFIIGDKGFSVSDDCTGCGLCVKRCPLCNITMEEKRPQWQGTCTHCMACIGGCPTEAINYKTKSKSRARHYIPER